MNIEYNQEKQQPLLPTSVLIFYQTNASGKALGIFHPLNEQQKLGAGKCVDLKEVEEIFRNNGSPNLSFLDGKILAKSTTSIVWYELSRKRPIYFQAPESKRKWLNEFSGTEIYWPNLLFKLEHNTLNCWALSSSRRPTLRTTLYYAPFTNVNSHRVCPPSGLEINPMDDIQKNAAIITNAIFNGHFSHRTNDMNNIKFRHSHDAFWRYYLTACRKNKITSFPAKYLQPTTTKLENILR